MWNLYIWLFLLFALVSSNAKRQNEGDLCVLENGDTGSCKQLEDCPKGAQDIIKNQKLPVFCVWRMYKPVICCENSTIAAVTELPDEPKKVQKTTKYSNSAKLSITTELSSVTTELLPTKAAINIATEPLLTTTTSRVPPCARHKVTAITNPTSTASSTTKLTFNDSGKSGIQRTSKNERFEAELDGSTANGKLPIAITTENLPIKADLRRKPDDAIPLNGVERSNEKGKRITAEALANELERTTKTLPSSSTISTTVLPTTETSTTTTTQLPFSEAARIAEKKCVEYSTWAESIILMPGGQEKIQGQCGINVEKFISKGNATSELEFPHMAHLGYGKENITFGCGASLISEKFLLTAAHCFIDSNIGFPTVAKLSTGESSSVKLVKLENGIFHPKYNGALRYHDIALIPLKNPVKFTDYMRPACIQVEKKLNQTEGTATGWGATGHYQSGSNILLKVNLTFIESGTCSSLFRSTRSLPNAFDDESMICAGGTDGKDTCPGDSGGPLQIIKGDPDCMYSIVGITSFGHKCGIAPAIYTRVSNYVPWIVSKVWPEEIGKEN